MHRVMIDTNVIISAVLFPGGTAHQAFVKAASPPFEPIISDYVLQEIDRKIHEKFSHKAAAFHQFLSVISLTFPTVPTPTLVYPDESQIRDPKDRPVLRSALAYQADYLLTGDKDLLESGLITPVIISPSRLLLE